LSLLDSLLDAIVRLGGDALVMHAGERPYVVTTSRTLDDFRGPLSWGQVELASRALTPEAMLSMLGQMLPPDLLRALDEIGAVEHEIDAPDGQHRFVVVAARGGDDVWVEVRRKVEAPPVVEPEPVPEPVPEAVSVQAAAAPDPAPAPDPMVAATAAAGAPIPIVYDAPGGERPAVEQGPQAWPGNVPADERPAQEPSVTHEEASAASAGEDDGEVTLTFDHPLVVAQEAAPDVLEIEAGDLAEGEWFSIQVPRTEAVAEAVPEPPAVSEVEPPAASEAEPPAVSEVEAPAVIQAEPPAVSEVEAPAVSEAEAPAVSEVEPPAVSEVEQPAASEVEPPAVSEVEPPAASEVEPPAVSEVEPPAASEVEPPAVSEVEPPAASEVEPPAVSEVEPPAASEVEPPAVSEVEPPAVSEVEPPAASEVEPVPVMRLQPRDPGPAHASTSAVADVLRDGLERGASTVYAIGGSRPLMRIEGEITSSASLPVLQPADIDRFAFEFAPRGEVAHSTAEWTTTVPGAGAVRCVSFEDAAGRGLVFHLAANISSADELGLGREIQALCSEPDGLVVVAGPRASGKSTLLGAFVDRINRSRADHVITIESRVRTLHARRHSLISQREVDGDGLAIARAARAALREGPDVLVIDDARAPETIAVAIDAARAGRLVFASLPAPSTAAAIERLTDAFAVDRRPQVRALLSGALRAVISQVLVHKAAGGRIAAREVLLSSPPVVQLIVDGTCSQVPVAIESGRRLGMRTLTDSLAALVRDGVIEADEAMRAAPDRRVLLAALRQEGVDVSELERRA
jgi:twitching motility protein PilT